MNEKISIDHSSLQHGAFHFTLPHTKKGKISWAIGAIMLLISGFLLLHSLQIPDVPPVSEAIAVDHPDDVSADDEVDLGAGWKGDTGNFITIEVIIEYGTLVHGYWTLDSDGENCTDHVDEFEDVIITVSPTSGGDSFSLGWYDDLGTEVSTNSRSCPGYEDWYIGEGDVVELFILKEGDELSLLSVGAEGLSIGERTEREDTQRGVLAIVIFSSLILMYHTPTSLSYDIKTLRKRWGNHPFVHGTPGNVRVAQGPVRQLDDSDWVLPPPSFDSWPLDPYQANDENTLIEEHPDVVGTPHPATFTLYSINGIVFVITSIWLASDLLARHGDMSHIIVGNILRVVLILFTVIWTYNAWKKWKLMHNILDTPTSRVRSVAAGSVELVGQIRPAPSGTLAVAVGGNSSQLVEGVVAYRWLEEELVCTKDNDGKETCNWVSRRDENGSTDFILHDGTGGILVQPSTWKNVEYGGQLYCWDRGNWRYTAWVLGAGDPIYCLGRAENRSNAEKEEGLDGSIQSSHLVVRGNKDIGMQVHLRRGTELSIISGLRSTTESIVIPLIMLTFSAIPFLW